MQVKVLAFYFTLVMILKVACAELSIVPAIEKRPDRLPAEIKHSHRRHRIHRQAHHTANELHNGDLAEVAPKYNHNCFFTPVNCQHRSQLKAVKVDAAELQRTELAKKDCKDCKLRRALGFLRRRNRFFTK